MVRVSPLSAASLVGAAGLCWLASPAQAQSGVFDQQPYGGGILPTVGTNSRIGDLRPQLERYFQPATTLVETPAWTYTGSADVNVGVTDNANRVSSPRRADIFTILSPTIVVTGDTSRLKLNLTYSPQYTAYASSSSQTRFDQFGNATALATIIPGHVFIDVRGSVSQQSLTGNTLNQGVTTNFNQQNDVQTTSISITPYAEQRFGGWGTVRVGYSLARTLQDSQNTSQNQQLVQTTSQAQLNGVNTLATPSYGAIGNLTTQRERASFASGENFGRFNLLSTAQAIQYSGGGSYQGAYRNELDNELGFALTRKLTLLGGLGYQDVRYGGTPSVQINEPSFNFGVRYAPGPDSTLTVLYGRRDGIGSVSFDGQFAPTARTRIIGRYSSGLTTDIEQSQNVLAATTVGPTGLVTDTATGAPVSTGGAGGIQNGVYRVHSLSLSALLLQDRDSYSLNLGTQDRTTVTNTTSILGGGIIPAGTTSSNMNISLAWQHDLAPDLNTNVTALYSTTTSSSTLLVGSSGSSRTVSLTAALNKQFSKTLSGSLRYTFTDQSGGPAFGSRVNTGSAFATGSNFSTGSNLNTGSTLNRGGSYTENVLLVGLHKSF